MPGPARSLEELQSSPIVRVAWTALPADFNIRTNDPLGGNRACRRIVVGTAGTLVITGVDGVNVTLPATFNGYVWDIQAEALVAAGTTALNVVLHW